MAGIKAPSGANMMLKAMGIDPEEIKGQIEVMRKGARDVIENFDARLKKIETDMAEVNRKLDVLIGLHELKTERIPEHGPGNDS